MFISISEQRVADSEDSGAITCQALARQATEYLENRLSAKARAVIERHLHTCSACHTYVEQLKLVRDSLGKLPEPTMPQAVLKSLAKRLARAARDGKKRS